MATVINNPTQPTDSGNSMGIFIGLIVLLVFMLLFFLYGLPIIRQSVSGTKITPQVNVLDKIDVNVNNK